MNVLNTVYQSPQMAFSEPASSIPISVQPSAMLNLTRPVPHSNQSNAVEGMELVGWPSPRPKPFWKETLLLCFGNHDLQCKKSVFSCGEGEFLRRNLVLTQIKKRWVSQSFSPRELIPVEVPGRWVAIFDILVLKNPKWLVPGGSAERDQPKEFWEMIKSDCLKP